MPPRRADRSRWRTLCEARPILRGAHNRPSREHESRIAVIEEDSPPIGCYTTTGCCKFKCKATQFLPRDIGGTEMAAAKCPRNDPMPARTLIRRSAAISSNDSPPPIHYLTASGLAILLGALIIPSLSH